MLSRPKPWTVLAIFAAAVVVATIILPHRLAYPFDDTFITFRYAHNLAQGFGFVWNPGGPHTEGFTNFLFVLLLSAADVLKLDLLWVSQSIGILSLLITAYLASRIASRLTRGALGLVAGLAIVADPFMWANAMSGMETNLFVMFVLAAWYAFLRDANSRSAYLIALLATLTRPEGAVIAAILFVLDWRRVGIGVAVRRALWFAVPVALYAVWKMWYFGDLLPNSFYVKVVQVRSGSGSKLLPGFGAVKHFYLQNLAIVIVALVSLGIALPRSRGRRSWLLLGGAWVAIMSVFYSASYLLMGRYDRFTLSIEAVLLVFFVLVLYYVPSRRALRVAAIVVLCAIFGVTEYVLRGGLDLVRVSGDPNAAYAKLGAAIATVPGHDSLRIASADAGVLPYYSGAQHIDLVGLNTNTIARARSTDQVFSEVIQSHPDIILVPVRVAPGDSCATIYREGHGLIGASYTEFVRRPEFARFRSLGRLDIGYYEVDVLCDTASRYSSGLAHATRGLLTPPTGCYQ